MAIIKFVSTLHPTKNHTAANLKQCIEYILNEKKTEGKHLTGTLNCRKDHVMEDMLETMSSYGKLNLNNTKNRLAYHFVISFKKGEEMTNDTALEIVREFCSRYLPGYESVFSAHVDKEHIHCHLCFNAVSYTSGMKYRYEDGEWAKTVQPLLDEICREHKLPTLFEDTGISIEEYDKDRKSRKRRQPGENKTCNNSKYTVPDESTGFSLMDMIRNDIDEAVSISSTFEEFLQILKERGYLVKQGNVKHMAVKPPGADAYRRLNRLDEEGFYSEESIKRRIADKKKKSIAQPVNKDYRFILPENYRYIPKQKVTGITGIYYAQIYRYGIAGKTWHVSYNEIKKNMREIDNIRKKLSVLSRLSEGSGILSSLKEEIEATDNRKEKVCVSLQENLEEQEEMKPLFKAAYRLEKLQPSYSKYKNGEEEGLKNKAEEYEELIKQINDAGYSREQLNEKKQELKENNRMLGSELKSIKKYEKLLGEIYEDVCREKEEDWQETYEEMEKQQEREDKNELRRKTDKKQRI